MKHLSDRLCVALDVSDSKAARSAALDLGDLVGMFKIGSELFTSEGPSVVKAITSLGRRVFLDLKFHDIPNTVGGAARAATRLGVSMFNVHAAGGADMVAAAVNAAREEAATRRLAQPKVLAVTVLTSLTDTMFETEVLGRVPVSKAVVHFALLARSAGADGVIASPQEIDVIREACGPDFIIGTPGVRPAWSTQGDQKRVLTPAEAIRRGADFIVVGRPILSAADRKNAAARVLEEMEQASV